MRTLACLLACPPVLHLGVHGQGGFFFVWPTWPWPGARVSEGLAAGGGGGTVTEGEEGLPSEPRTAGCLHLLQARDKSRQSLIWPVGSHFSSPFFFSGQKFSMRVFR